MTSITNYRIEVELGLIITRDLKAVGNTVEKAIRPAIERARNALISFKSGFQAVERGGLSFNKALSVTNSTLFKMGAMTATARRGLQNFGQSLNKWFKQFDGWAMSLMFFGMAIQRVFTNLWKQSTKVFQEMAHSIEGVVTPFDMLTGMFQYLMFTVGDALSSFLEPYLPVIAEIIDKWATWINDNKELFAKIVLVGGAIGSLLMIFGMVWLGLKPIFQGIFLLFTKAWIAPLLFLTGVLLPTLASSFSRETKTVSDKVSNMATYIVAAVGVIVAALAGAPTALVILVGALSVLVFKIFDRMGFAMGIWITQFNERIKDWWAEALLHTIEGIYNLFNAIRTRFNNFVEKHPKIAEFMGWTVQTSGLTGLETALEEARKKALAAYNALNKVKLEGAEALAAYTEANPLFPKVSNIFGKLSIPNPEDYGFDDSTTAPTENSLVAPSYKEPTLGQNTGVMQNVYNIQQVVVDGNFDDFNRAVNEGAQSINLTENVLV